MDDFEYTQENITRRIQKYIKDNGYELEDGFKNGIKFSIGLDTWIIILTEISKNNRNVCMILLHKDNYHMMHKLYKGIPGYHIQKKVMYTSDILECVDYAIDHKNKWSAK